MAVSHLFLYSLHIGMSSIGSKILRESHFDGMEMSVCPSARTTICGDGCLQNDLGVIDADSARAIIAGPSRLVDLLTSQEPTRPHKSPPAIEGDLH